MDNFFLHQLRINQANSCALVKGVFCSQLYAASNKLAAAHVNSTERFSFSPDISFRCPEQQINALYSCLQSCYSQIKHVEGISLLNVRYTKVNVPQGYDKEELESD